MFQIIQDISFHKLFINLKKSTVTVFDACVRVSCVYLCRSSFLRFNIRFRIIPHFLTHYLTSTSWFWQMTLYTYVQTFGVERVKPDEIIFDHGCTSCIESIINWNVHVLHVYCTYHRLNHPTLISVEVGPRLIFGLMLRAISGQPFIIQSQQQPVL